MSKSIDTMNETGVSYSVQLNGAHKAYAQFNRKYDQDECEEFIMAIVLTGKLGKLTCKPCESRAGKPKLKFMFPSSTSPVFWLQGIVNMRVTKAQLLKGAVELLPAEESKSMAEQMAML